MAIICIFTILVISTGMAQAMGLSLVVACTLVEVLKSYALRILALSGPMISIWIIKNWLGF
ncbi:hypothetical protein SPWS13_2608 [Shewanella putrefaciens]|nr:hypothetical protein SPWS13_2608 [Shewanella putrefaciens]